MLGLGRGPAQQTQQQRGPQAPQQQFQLPSNRSVQCHLLFTFTTRTQKAHHLNV